MDQKVTDVLDEYHTRIATEKIRRQAIARVPEREGGPDTWMRAVGPQTGQLLNIVVKAMASPNILEIGTSYGYSGIWLAEAARAAGGRVTTLELHDYKSAYAHSMALKAGLADHIDFKVGDAVDLIASLPGKFDFILLDLWKDLYIPCLEVFYPKLNPGAIIVADNMLRPGGDEVKAYRAAIAKKGRITSVLLPVGTGIEISRFAAEASQSS
jgi:predicted O-methyltransferase YrrM